MVFQLNDDLVFPDPHLGEEEGILAIGGDLRPERLLLAYYHGIFPWFSFRDSPIQWWCPMKRFVIFPNEIHISHSMRQEMKRVERGEIIVTFNRAFEKVIDRCGSKREHMVGAWLGDDMKQAYIKLHEMGYAISVEVWRQGELVGGLYGVQMGKGFYGESMFSDMPSGSKIALIELASVLDYAGCELIDCQFETPHLKSMGGRYIDYEEYLKIIRGEEQ